MDIDRLKKLSGIKLTETFDKSVPYTWNMKTDNQYIATFSINAEEYMVAFLKGSSNFVNNISGQYENDIWDVNFVNTNDILAALGNAMNHGQNVFVIFSTIIKIIVDFVKQKNPHGFSFSSAKSNPKRKAVYDKIVKRFDDMFIKFGYHKTDDVVIDRSLVLPMGYSISDFTTDIWMKS